MDGASTSAAALKEEIARLAGAIDKFKSTDVKSGPSSVHSRKPRSNVYINPNYRPPDKPRAPHPYRAPQPPPPARPPPSTEKKDVIIGGVAFESSGRSLVRKDCTPSCSPRFIQQPVRGHDLSHRFAVAVARPTPPPAAVTAARTPTTPGASFASSRAAQLGSSRAPPSKGRVYKPKMTRRGRPMNRNMTLTNSRRPDGARRRKYVDKPCPRFTTTGACTRGLTCPYTHDPTKTAICWPFLHGTCPHTAATCALSHDPTPERTPLCVHFANAGRCTRSEACPFPHVKVGRREGVCRDFAVLGYCEKGLDCVHQHVRECPDFAERGVCGTKGCKLPHVIRANRNRPKDKDAGKKSAGAAVVAKTDKDREPLDASASGAATPHAPTAEEAQLGDEYISLTFMESESDSDADDEDDGDGDDEDEDGEAEHGEEAGNDGDGDVEEEPGAAHADD